MMPFFKDGPVLGDSQQGGDFGAPPGSAVFHRENSTVFRFPSVHIAVKNYRKHLGKQNTSIHLG